MTRDSGRIPDRFAETGGDRVPPAAGPHEALPHGANRLPWYSTYLALAAFIIGALAANAYLYYQSHSSYEHVIVQTARIRDKMRWLAHVRLAVESLNAPVNDIFGSGDRDQHIERFETRRREVDQLMERRREFDADLTEFTGHLQLMAKAERAVFAELSESNKPSATPEDRERVFRPAAAAMAAADRHCRDATGSLNELEQLALMRIGSLLHEHGRRLRVYSWIGRALSALAFCILVALLWYGRRLLLVQADIVLTRNSVLWERRERLASVGELCSSVAHGIRNPLASISTSAQLILETETLNDQSTRRLEDIHTECRRLADRVAHLLQFASGPGENVQNYAFQQAVERALDEMRPRLEAATISATSRLDVEPLLVRGDPERMTLAITEILANAIDNLRTGDRIAVTCARDAAAPDHLVFDYVDSGPGIPAERRAFVFDLFFSTKPGGTGIGLATAKRAAELHGGQLSIVDSAQPGLCLRMRLPLVSGAGP